MQFLPHGPSYTLSKFELGIVLQDKISQLCQVGHHLQLVQLQCCVSPHQGGPHMQTWYFLKALSILETKLICFFFYSLLMLAEVVKVWNRVITPRFAETHCMIDDSWKHIWWVWSTILGIYSNRAVLGKYSLSKKVLGLSPNWTFSSSRRRRTRKETRKSRSFPYPAPFFEWSLAKTCLQPAGMRFYAFINNDIYILIHYSNIAHWFKWKFSFTF